MGGIKASWSTNSAPIPSSSGVEDVCYLSCLTPCCMVYQQDTTTDPILEGPNKFENVESENQTNKPGTPNQQSWEFGYEDGKSLYEVYHRGCNVT